MIVDAASVLRIRMNRWSAATVIVGAEIEYIQGTLR